MSRFMLTYRYPAQQYLHTFFLCECSTTTTDLLNTGHLTSPLLLEKKDNMFVSAISRGFLCIILYITYLEELTNVVATSCCNVNAVANLEISTPCF